MRVLLVEDELSLAEVIVKRLHSEGYGVDACHDGNDALDYIDQADYDCIILDLQLPGLDGLSVLRHIRQKRMTTPVMILTAKFSTSDRVVGLDTGADDYIVKPFSFDELLARLRALIRRKNGQESSELRLADLVIDLSSKTATRAGRSIDLTSKEYAVLEYLMFNKNKILTRDQIIDHIWNYDFNCSSNIVDVYVRYLRKKIDDNYTPKLIHTLRGRGYIMRDGDNEDRN